MLNEITIDKAGRVVIPKPLRDKLHLRPGDSLRLRQENGHIVLSPVRPQGRLIRRGPIWVYDSGTDAKLTVEEVDAVIEAVRERRDEDLF